MYFTLNAARWKLNPPVGKQDRRRNGAFQLRLAAPEWMFFVS